MAHFKHMVIFQGASGVPEDRFVNTFHTDSPSDVHITEADQVSAALGQFYETPPDGRTESVGQMLSPYVNRAYEIRTYRMLDPIQRVPEIRERTLPAPPAAVEGLPEEVAIVVSFHGDAPVTPRTRGRIFLGPLNTFALDGGSTSTPATVDMLRRLILTEASERLANHPDMAWAVYSPTALTLTEVTGGFVDSAYDTMRKRGPVASTRSIWPAAV